ncbi:hypothetical protein EIP91_011282 [Steccherinum ochraceum]|uniref:F-box domain-containing protein n=1 Tax=Steccherinum ochraceum TaxID=92696 RepID=A0A4R0QZU4_9APHY|nr:hypothetical protein EIP91_011282 [Steccherinum ochraceum]
MLPKNAEKQTEDIEQGYDTRSLIACLPNELLAHIFVLEQQSCRSSEKLVPLYQLSRVCWHWRRLVLGMPELWSTIYTRPIVSGEEYAELEYALERSQGALLHVNITDESNVHTIGSKHTNVSLQTEESGSPRKTRHSSLKLLTRHRHRVRSLSLYQDLPNIEEVLRFIPLNGPPLVVLNVTNLSLPSPHDSDGSLLIPDLSSSQLSHLVLSGFCATWLSNPFPKSLVTLQISHWQILGVTPRRRWQELFDALGCLLQLTSLELSDDTLSGNDNSPVEFPLIKSTISLPQLAVVRLEGNAFASVYFLEHLVTPPSTRLFLCFEKPFDPAIIPRLVISSASITNIEQQLGPFVLNVSPSCILVSDLHTTVPITTLPVPLTRTAPDTARLFMTMSSTDLDDADFRDPWVEVEHAVDFRLAEILQICSYPWVRSTCAVRIHNNMLTSSKDEWRGMLRSMPHLQSLWSEKMDLSRAVLPSLLAESEDVEDPDGNATPPPCNKFLVPSLNTLGLPLSAATCRGKHRPTVYQQIDEWRAMFRVRRAAGCADIRLELRVCQDDDARVPDEEVTRLREVTEVVLLREGEYGGEVPVFRL